MGFPTRFDRLRKRRYLHEVVPTYQGLVFRWLEEIAAAETFSGSEVSLGKCWYRGLSKESQLRGDQKGPHALYPEGKFLQPTGYLVQTDKTLSRQAGIEEWSLKLTFSKGHFKSRL